VGSSVSEYLHLIACKRHPLIGTPLLLTDRLHLVEAARQLALESSL
jgi:hypothetical protein